VGYRCGVGVARAHVTLQQSRCKVCGAQLAVLELLHPLQLQLCAPEMSVMSTAYAASTGASTTASCVQRVCTM
jgi:hypothetical protein